MDMKSFLLVLLVLIVGLWIGKRYPEQVATFTLGVV
jgi:hypothetical protein